MEKIIDTLFSISWIYLQFYWLILVLQITISVKLRNSCDIEDIKTPCTQNTVEFMFHWKDIRNPIFHVPQKWEKIVFVGGDDLLHNETRCINLLFMWHIRVPLLLTIKKFNNCWSANIAWVKHASYGRSYPHISYIINCMCLTIKTLSFSNFALRYNSYDM